MYTTAERYHIYKQATLALAYGGRYFGICYAIALEVNGASAPINLSLFPEVEAFKPKRSGLLFDSDSWYWFPLDSEGMKKRFDILTTAMQQTKPKLLEQ